jgi:nicotinamidase/pyrazinamidase
VSEIGDNLVFFDVDTQVDFMCPTGALYVPEAEQIIPNIKRLMDWAREKHVPVISTADAHIPDDDEFKIWPPHCVAGTPGQRRISETAWPDAVVVPRAPGAFKRPAHWDGQFIVEKRAYAVQDNPNFEAIVQALENRRAVVFGVATEYCVRAAVLDLCRQNFKVDLVVDAIKPITLAGGEKAVSEMIAAGAKTVTTEEIVGSSLAT